MSLWTWVLIALCAAGAALAVISSVIVLAGVVQLNRRLTQLRQSPFVTKLESLQIQVGRLSRVGDDAEQLRDRAGNALRSLKEAPATAGFDRIARAWSECAQQLKTIVADLS